VSGADHGSLLLAINSPSGADEANLKLPDGTPDLAAIFTLRISRWMVAHNYLTGVSADPPATATTGT